MYSFPITEDRYDSWKPQLPPLEANVVRDGAPSRVTPPHRCTERGCRKPAVVVRTGKGGQIEALCAEHR